MKILIVDDDYTSLKVLSHYMKPYGEVVQCGNAYKAIKLSKKSFSEDSPFGLYLLDIMMPEINGHELLTEIRSLEKKHPDLPVSKIIMVSALSDTENIMNAFNENCDSYLTKPLRMEKLSEELSRLDISRQ